MSPDVSAVLLAKLIGDAEVGGLDHEELIKALE